MRQIEHKLSRRLQRNLHNILEVTWQEVQSQPYESCSQSVRPSPSSWIAVTSCHWYQLISSAPNSGCRYVYNNQPKILSNFEAYGTDQTDQNNTCIF
jgi:hypothetical protein